eukprot:scaffold220_cov169-Amphora_coffeaeformis.AAC.18
MSWSTVSAGDYRDWNYPNYFPKMNRIVNDDEGVAGSGYGSEGVAEVGYRRVLPRRRDSGCNDRPLVDPREDDENDDDTAAETAVADRIVHRGTPNYRRPVAGRCRGDSPGGRP